jgi:hypothetical protein
LSTDLLLVPFLSSEYQKQSWVTAPAVRSTNKWLQNLSLVVSQLSCRGASNDTHAFLMCLDDLCNRFWQNTYLRRFLLTWVQNGPVGFEKNIAY